MATVKHVFKLQSYICICLTFGSKLRSLWRNFLYSKYLMNKYVNYRYSTHTIEYCTLYSTAVLYSIVVYLIFGYSQKCFTVGDFSVPGSKVGKIRWLSWKIVCLAGQLVFWDFDTFYKVGKIRWLLANNKTSYFFRLFYTFYYFTVCP